MARVFWTALTGLSACTLTVALVGARVVRAAAGEKPLTGQVVSLDATTLVLKDEAGKQSAFKLTKASPLWRFGNPDALPDEFKPGDRITVWLPARGREPLRVTDEITELVRRNECYRVVNQDPDNYRFTLQRIALGTGTEIGKPLTLEYARPTYLVLREKPEFVFRVRPDQRLWINTATQRNSDVLVAREVLDEASRIRFQRQQQLRAAARLAPVTGPVSFEKDIWPILEVNCLSCHRSGDAQSGYSLSTRERLLKGGPRGVAVTPGKSAESLLYLTMTGDRNPRMPPDRDPTPEQLQLIKRWIDAGAHVDESKLK
ncbi:MAG: c-type cytochrome domain-containing protein [Actinomycetota bacterium]